MSKAIPPNDGENDRHHEVANLTLSGSNILVGSYSHADGGGIYFKTDEMVEAVYISPIEAALLSMAIETAIAEHMDDN